MNNVLFEIAFEYGGKLYHEAVNKNEIDPEHYERIYDYWFGGLGDELGFELTGDKDENNNFLPKRLYVNVYFDEDTARPDDQILDLWLKLPGEKAFTKVHFND